MQEISMAISDPTTHSANPRQSMPYTAAILLACFSATSLSAMIWIEVLNYRAGNVLPRASQSGTQKKWRIASERSHMPAQPANSAGHSKEERPKSDQMEDAQRQKARAQAQLRSVVASIGIAQYILAPLIILGGVWMICVAAFRRSRMFFSAGLAAICVGLTSLMAAVFRAYWSSLGW